MGTVEEQLMDLAVTLPPKICYFAENVTYSIIPVLPFRICLHVDTVFAWLGDFYYYAMSLSDKRVMDWPLMRTPLPMGIITYLYIVFAVMGPKVMKNRKPYDLRWLIVLYNLSLSIANIYMATKILYLATKLNYSYLCMPIIYGVDPPDDPDELEVVKVYYFCFLTKMVDFMDTVFFVLRKKTEQLSFLHVYHHASMFMFWWGLLHWFSTGGPTFQCLVINSYIHFFMYLYYGLAALGPEMQKRLWWKKYLTRLQLIQFMYAVILVTVQLIVKCPMPSWMLIASFAYCFTLIILFGNFYYHAYRKKKEKKLQQQATATATDKPRVEEVVDDQLINNVGKEEEDIAVIQEEDDDEVVISLTA